MVHLRIINTILIGIVVNMAWVNDCDVAKVFSRSFYFSIELHHYTIIVVMSLMMFVLLLIIWLLQTGQYMDNGTRDKFEKGIIILFASNNYGKDIRITPQPKEEVDIKIQINGKTILIEAKGSNDSVSGKDFIKAIMQIGRTWDGVKNVWEIWIAPRTTFNHSEFNSKNLSTTVIPSVISKLQKNWPNEWKKSIKNYAYTNLPLIEFVYKNFKKNDVLQKLHNEAKDICVNTHGLDDRYIDDTLYRMNTQIDYADFRNEFHFSENWLEWNYKFVALNNSSNYSFMDFKSKPYFDSTISKEDFEKKFSFNDTVNKFFLSFGQDLPDAIVDYLKEKLNV